MARKNLSKRDKILDEILMLKEKRQTDIIKIVCAILTIILVIMGKPLLENTGIISQDNVIIVGAMYIIAILLATFTGFAGRDYARSGSRINELCTKNSISQNEIKTYSRS